MRDKIVIVGPDRYGWPLSHLGDTTDDLTVLAVHPERVRLVLFTGGEDVHPSLYKGYDPQGLCWTSLKRDRFELRLFKHCRQHRIKMTGICRGFQFLNVMNGGFMYQHLEGHAGQMHKTFFPASGDKFIVSSTHHQLVRLHKSAVPIGVAAPTRSQYYIDRNGCVLTERYHNQPEYEIEAAVFPRINSFGVQYHPETMSEDSAAVSHYMTMVEDFLDMDIEDFTMRYGRRIEDGEFVQVRSGGAD